MYNQPTNQNPGAYQKRAIGGWTAASNGLQPGKNVEYVVEEITTGKGGTFRSVSFYKPYQSRKPEKAGQWERSFNFRVEDHAELVERLNHMLQNFSSIPGRYVFQPIAAQPQYQQQATPMMPNHPINPMGYQPQPQQMPMQQPMQQPMPAQPMTFQNPTPPNFNPNQGNNGGNW